MDEVGSDEELCAAVGECANGVCVPDFLKEAFTHDVMCAGFEAGGEDGGHQVRCQSRISGESRAFRKFPLESNRAGRQSLRPDDAAAWRNW